MITCYFGLPGCGKSTMLAMIAARELKRIRKGKSKYKQVLSNYYIAGCKKISFKDIGVYDMSDSLILIDEITLDADSRNFKDFPHKTKQFFILHRHYNCDIIYATQQYDGVDRKIRELTADLWYMRKSGSITFSTAIYRHITITEESDIKVGYVFPTIFQFLTNVRSNVKVCVRPFYYKYFDSFESPSLPYRPFDDWGSIPKVSLRDLFLNAKKQIASAVTRIARKPMAWMQTLLSKIRGCKRA